MVGHQGRGEDVRRAVHIVHGEDYVESSVPKAPHAASSHGGDVGAYSRDHV